MQDSNANYTGHSDTVAAGRRHHDGKLCGIAPRTLSGDSNLRLFQPADSGGVVYVEGPLRHPISHDLRHRVRSLLRRGEREIVLDLARVSTIDAAGVGELVRAYNMTVAKDGVLRIAHVTKLVREMLVRAGLFTFVTGDRATAA